MLKDKPVESLPAIFEGCATRILGRFPEIDVRWDDIRRGRKLTIYRQEDAGFDVVVEAETYGLYPYTGEWHGAPWEPGTEDPVELCEERIISA